MLVYIQHAKVIRACLFIVVTILEVTQRVPPTCPIKTNMSNKDRTYHVTDPGRGGGALAIIGKRMKLSKK